MITWQTRLALFLHTSFRAVSRRTPLFPTWDPILCRPRVAAAIFCNQFWNGMGFAWQFAKAGNIWPTSWQCGGCSVEKTKNRALNVLRYVGAQVNLWDWLNPVICPSHNVLLLSALLECRSVLILVAVDELLIVFGNLFADQYSSLRLWHRRHPPQPLRKMYLKIKHPFIL